MKTLENDLKDELTKINKLIDDCARKTKNTKHERLVVTTTHGKYNQYFLIVETENGQKRRKRLPKSEVKTARSIIQQDYYASLHKDLLLQRKAIIDFLKKYNPTAITDTYDRLCDGRKQLITPVEMPIDEYIETWLSNHPGEQDDIHDRGTEETKRGEFVKSKSEKIIADLLYDSNIVYQYETKIILKNGCFLFPDFTILNKRTRKTYYWEHLGLLTDMNYATRNWKKIGDYESNNIILGDNLFITYEHTKDKLDVSQLKDRIQRYLV